MKILAIVFALVVAVVADDEWRPKTLAEANNITTECLKDSAVPEDILVQIEDGKHPNVESVRKFYYCYATRLGFFSDKDGIIVDRVVKQFDINLSESETRAIAEGCNDKNEQKSSNEEWAFRFHMCILESKLGSEARKFHDDKVDE